MLVETASDSATEDLFLPRGRVWGDFRDGRNQGWPPEAVITLIEKKRKMKACWDKVLFPACFSAPLLGSPRSQLMKRAAERQEERELRAPDSASSVLPSPGWG